jgi:hypothetical protein
MRWRPPALGNSEQTDRQTDRQTEQKIASQHLQVKCYKRPVEKHFLFHISPLLSPSFLNPDLTSEVCSCVLHTGMPAYCTHTHTHTHTHTRRQARRTLGSEHSQGGKEKPNVDYWGRGGEDLECGKVGEDLWGKREFASKGEPIKVHGSTVKCAKHNAQYTKCYFASKMSD